MVQNKGILFRIVVNLIILVLFFGKPSCKFKEKLYFFYNDLSPLQYNNCSLNYRKIIIKNNTRCVQRLKAVSKSSASKTLLPRQLNNGSKYSKKLSLQKAKMCYNVFSIHVDVLLIIL